MTNDEADDRYGSVNVAENDSLRLAGVKFSAVITLQTEWRHRTEKMGHEIKAMSHLRISQAVLLRDACGCCDWNKSLKLHRTTSQNDKSNQWNLSIISLQV